MRKLIFLIGAVLFINFYTYCQTNKGSFVFGTDVIILNFNNDKAFDNPSKSSKYSNNLFEISPRLSYFFIDNFELGMFYKYFKQENKSDEILNSFNRYINSYLNSTQTIGFISKYHRNISNDLNLFSELNLGYGIVDNISENSYVTPSISQNSYTDKVTQKGFTLIGNFKIGFEYYIKKRLGIELKFDILNIENSKLEQTEQNDGVGFSSIPIVCNVKKSEFNFFHPSIFLGLKFNLINKTEIKTEK